MHALMLMENLDWLDTEHLSSNSSIRNPHIIFLQPTVAKQDKNQKVCSELLSAKKVF